MHRTGRKHDTRVIPAARPQFSEASLETLVPDIESILRTGQLILGPHTQRFEQAFADYVGARHAVAVSSCSAALQIVLRFYGIEDREVIVPTNNFPGVISAILYERGIPVLAEMDERTFCMDIDDALSRVTPKTAGFIVVHIAGRIQPRLDELRQFCDDNGLFLVEDASHAHGASVRGRKAGALAETACFSLYPTKNMTSLTGGMITSESPALADWACSLRHHGQDQSRRQFVRNGSDWCMSEIHAAVGLSQLGELDALIARRNQVVSWYRLGLRDVDWVSIPEHDASDVHAYYKLPTLLDATLDRDRLQRVLEDQYGIQNGTIYDPPCHLQPVHRKLFSGRPGMFPVADPLCQ